MKKKAIDRARAKSGNARKTESPKHWIPYPIGKVLKELEFGAKKKGGNLMTKKEALAIACKDITRTQFDLYHAEARHALPSEMEALQRKLEYRKYIMKAVEKLDAAETFSR